MELLGRLELFSRTFDNRFVFSLFNLLLCGVIVLVIARGWRAKASFQAGKNHFLLFLAFSALGASFALDSVFSGAIFFFGLHPPEGLIELCSHLFQASSWVLLAASAFFWPRHRQVGKLAISGSHLLLSPLFAWLGWSMTVRPSQLSAALDLVSLIFVGMALILFYRRPLGGRQFATVALGLMTLSVLLHISGGLAPGQQNALILWNIEQSAWSLSLFIFALAIGETNRDLFDKVFVRLQIAFILLASVMILVITQTEKTEYLASIRDRSDQLAEFVRGNMDRFRDQNKPLSEVIKREDFFRQAMPGFGNLPELKIIRISTDNEVATLEIVDKREIHSDLKVVAQSRQPERLDSDAYFLIQGQPLKGGEVEFYGTRQFLDQHIRKRIILIFSLFTGLVAISTLMIGLVVRGASGTIRRQTREIAEAQQRLLQASKLAAIGELASGVAHEINNPATSILGLTSFWLAQGETDTLTCPREDLNEIMAQAQCIARITGDMLTFSRHTTLNIRLVPLDRAIASALRSVNDLLLSNRISVERELQPGLPAVPADEDSLVRVLVNLYRNAIGAMPDGGTLRIEAREENAKAKQVRLEIADTGSGIVPEYLPRIFDPFFTTKEVGKGTGLGLSIVHGIIKEHQGSIQVESQPGMGTKFTIVLPTEGY